MSVSNRVFKTNKTVKLSIAAVAADATVPQSSGAVYIDLSDVNWAQITVEINCTVLTGTSFILKGLTTNDKDNGGATTDIAAVKADGSTAFNSASITATGRYNFSTGRYASTGAAATNIGKYVGFWIDVTSATVTADVFIHISGQ